jgi:putative glutamine amidotransferase
LPDVVSRPVIGICAAVERAAWASWELESNLTPRSYTRAVANAGGQAVILPPDDAVAQSPDEALDLVDGLMLAGGSDIDPSAYGALPHPETRRTRPERDRFELALAHRALERGLPVLGVCRGMELLNVALGGTLEQHLDRLDVHRHTPGAFCDHEVRLEPGSLAARAVGAETTTVRSHHHQGIAEPGEGLVPSGWSLPDGLVEAVELPEQAFVLGVLWHPEEDERDRVVGALVEEARMKAVAS